MYIASLWSPFSLAELEMPSMKPTAMPRGPTQEASHAHMSSPFLGGESGSAEQSWAPETPKAPGLRRPPAIQAGDDPKPAAFGHRQPDARRRAARRETAGAEDGGSVVVRLFGPDQPHGPHHTRAQPSRGATPHQPPNAPGATDTSLPGGKGKVAGSSCGSRREGARRSTFRRLFSRPGQPLRAPRRKAPGRAPHPPPGNMVSSSAKTKGAGGDAHQRQGLGLKRATAER